MVLKQHYINNLHMITVRIRSLQKGNVFSHVMSVCLFTGESPRDRSMPLCPHIQPTHPPSPFPCSMVSVPWPVQTCLINPSFCVNFYRVNYHTGIDTFTLDTNTQFKIIISEMSFRVFLFSFSSRTCQNHLSSQTMNFSNVLMYNIMVKLRKKRTCFIDSRIFHFFLPFAHLWFFSW